MAMSSPDPPYVRMHSMFAKRLPDPHSSMFGFRFSDGKTDLSWSVMICVDLFMVPLYVFLARREAVLVGLGNVDGYDDCVCAHNFPAKQQQDQQRSGAYGRRKQDEAMHCICMYLWLWLSIYHVGQNSSTLGLWYRSIIQNWSNIWIQFIKHVNWIQLGINMY